MTCMMLRNGAIKSESFIIRGYVTTLRMSKSALCFDCCFSDGLHKNSKGSTGLLLEVEGDLDGGQTESRTPHLQ